MNTMMTHAVVGETVAHTGANPPGVLARLLNLVWRRFVRIQEMRGRQKTLAALRGLDDRMLKDIGLSRSELMSASYVRPSDRSGS